jgi:FAD/FMN-containing dehydrogenase
MTSRVVSSWGNVIHAPHALYDLRARDDRFPQVAASSKVLPFGNGRSYGDSCLNVGGALLQTRTLHRFIAFDRETGVLACESGVLLADILRLVVPHGWFPAAVPGTCYVTVGGAIANDVHGKNHHRAGTFGGHVRRLELLRSNNERLVCSPLENPQWFSATVGGLGLTGVITWAELQLRRIPGPQMSVETIRFANVDEFFALAAEAESRSEYTVAWIDCLGRGKHLGRGLLQLADHVRGDAVGPRGTAHSGDTAGPVPVRGKISIPLPLPVSLVNALSLRIFNTLYYRRQFGARRRTTQNFQPFFFPLDGIGHWNRLYGPRGFYQYQCVVPTPTAPDATAKLLETIARSGLGSFLAVLKRFGSASSPGMLSFPREGVTLALDFPNKGARVERLFEALDEIVGAAGGTLYPAKDGRMPGSLFRIGYPRWQEFSQYIDPACSSSFWRRVLEQA